jgi:uncharacterized damage-inducible protein DinB
MMIAHFTDLYAYNQWANERVIKALENAQGGTSRCLQLMTHILSAQQAWLQRITNIPRTVALWDTLPLEQLKPLFAENHQHWNNFWANFQADQFDDKVSYTNSQGKAYSNTVKDIVTHNVNHATYHRAQINQLLRQNGYEPVLTDFIAYRREKTGQD